MTQDEFQKVTQSLFNLIFKSFDEIDPDEAEADLSSDNIKIQFANKTQFVINRQMATSQIWLATRSKGYHFNYIAKDENWICDKTGSEFFSLLEKEIAAELGNPFQMKK
ncbi:MAG: iron donor protein CyaY [Deltaproteobacteria bacterium]|nr:iron donor protein CyaY [Deltaproteobacteria bacterium]